MWHFSCVLNTGTGTYLFQVVFAYLRGQCHEIFYLYFYPDGVCLIVNLGGGAVQKSRHTDSLIMIVFYWCSSRKETFIIPTHIYTSSHSVNYRYELDTRQISNLRQCQLCLCQCSLYQLEHLYIYLYQYTNKPMLTTIHAYQFIPGLWIRIQWLCGSGSVLEIRIQDPDPGARNKEISVENALFSYFLNLPLKRYKIALTTFWKKNRWITLVPVFFIWIWIFWKKLSSKVLF
jgi:hypothetical protein